MLKHSKIIFDKISNSFIMNNNPNHNVSGNVPNLVIDVQEMKLITN